jgi:hypothetical protein
LKDDEAVCFNNGEGMLDLHMADCKATKGKIPWRWITSPSGVAEVADRMRWWFIETWENDLFKAGRASLLDPVAAQNADEAAAKAAATAAMPADKDTTAAASGGPSQEIKPDVVVEPPAPALSPVPPPATTPTPVPVPIPPVASKPKEDVAQNIKKAANKVPTDPNLRTTPAPIVEAGAKEPEGTPRGGGAEVNKTAQPAAASPDDDAWSAGQTITPAEISKQAAAYRELLATNPFLLVDYSDFIGLERARANAKQRTEIPAEDQAMVGPNGSVGGNISLVKEAAENEGSRKDMFRVPADLLADDPAGELAKRTISGLPGNAPAPEALKNAAKETRGMWNSV